MGVQMVAANALYVLILVFASGEVQVIQNLNQQTCYAARDVIRNASALVSGKTPIAVCLNTNNPLGTP